MSAEHGYTQKAKEWWGRKSTPSKIRTTVFTGIALGLAAREAVRHYPAIKATIRDEVVPLIKSTAQDVKTTVSPLLRERMANLRGRVETEIVSFLNKKTSPTPTGN